MLKTNLITALDIATVNAILVLDKFTNARVAMCHARAFETVLVRLAHRVERVNWWAMAWVGHWSVA